MSPLDSVLTNENASIAPGIYHFEAELIFGDNKYINHTDKFICQLYTDENFSLSLDIILNSDVSNFNVVVQ